MSSPSPTAAARLEAAAKLLTQAPPGQTSQVYHDLRGILLDPHATDDAAASVTDAQIKKMAASALARYNAEQLIPVAIDEGGDQVIICDAGRVDANGEEHRFAHPRLGKSFVFDHMARTASKVEDLAIHEDVEPIRAALDAALQSYVADRYNSGVSSVFTVSNVPPPAPPAASSEPAGAPAAAAHAEAAETSEDTAEKPEEAAAETEPSEDQPEAKADADDGAETAPDAPAAEDTAKADEPMPTDEAAQEERKIRYTFHHVGNKYHLSNFWSGRWRASYTLDPDAGTLTSQIAVQVHYFENGNVQLNSSKPHVFSLPTGAGEMEAKKLAEQVVRMVEKHEDEYQQLLETTYDDLGEKAFKALRRQLPLTKNKIDWNQLMNYRLGDELAKQ